MGESLAAGTRRLGCGYSIRGFVFSLHCPAVGRNCIGSCDLFTQGGNLLIELFKLCQGERYGAAGGSKGRSGGEGNAGVKRAKRGFISIYRVRVYGGARAQSKSFQYSSADPQCRPLFLGGFRLEGLTVSLCLVTKLPSRKRPAIAFNPPGSSRLRCYREVVTHSNGRHRRSETNITEYVRC
jgi:hypothetical protein